MSLLLALLLLISIPASAQTAIPTALQQEDAAGDPVTYEFAGGRRPHVASDGMAFLVVSTNYPFYSISSQVFVSLVDADGKPLLPTTYQFWSAGSEATVAAGANGYLVVWSHTGGTNGVRIDSRGKILDSALLTLHKPTFSDSGIRGLGGMSPVAWNGSEFVVLTMTGSPITAKTWIATRVAESGSVIQNDIPVIAHADDALIAGRSGVSLILTRKNGSTASRTLVGDVLSSATELTGTFDEVAAGDDGFLAVSRTASELIAQHFDGNGHPDRPPFTIVGGELVHASVTRSGAAYLVGWTSAWGKIGAMRITGAGDRLEVPVVVTYGDWAEVASNGRSGLLAFTPDENSATYVAPVRESAPARMPYRGLLGQNNPIVTWDGSEPHLTWNGPDLREKRIGSAESMTIAADVHVVAIASRDISKLYVGFDANGLEAWAPNSARVLLDSSYGQFYRVVPLGNDFIVVWSRPTTSDAHILTARVSAEGRLIEAPHPIASVIVRDLAIGASRDSVLVVYNDGWGVVRGLLITPHGVVATEDLTVPLDFPHTLSVASDGNNFLVTWLNQNVLQSNDYVGGQFVSAEGHVIGAKRIFTTGGDAKAQSKTFWTGSNYLLLWSRGPDYATQSDLWAVRVTGDGELLDYPAVHVGALNGRLNSAVIGPAGQLAVAYTRNKDFAALAGLAYSRVILVPRQRSATHR